MLTPLHTTSNFLYCMFLIGSTWAERMVDTWTTLSTVMPVPFSLQVDPLHPGDDLTSKTNNQKIDVTSTLTDELYTPLTSIRAASEILYDNPNLDVIQRQQFLDIILKESEKLTQVVTQTLSTIERVDKLGKAEPD